MDQKLVLMRPIKRLMDKFNLSLKLGFIALVVVLVYGLSVYHLEKMTATVDGISTATTTLINEDGSKKEASLDEQTDLLSSDNTDSSLGDIKSAKRMVHSDGRVFELVGFFAVLFLLYSLGGVYLSVKDSLSVLLSNINDIRLGKLNGSPSLNSHDDIGSLVVNLTQMQATLLSLLGEISDVSKVLHSSAQEIASGNAALSERTQEQASCLVETSSSLNHLTETIRKNAENAQSAATLSKDATLVTERGGEAVNQVIVTMSEINASAQKIQDITGVIDGIAFQTNLLALNASVEAARAGEQGRGFAVVASEVRNLAQRSAEAAKQIKSLISDSMDKVNSGDIQVKQTYEAMQDIVKSIKNVNELIAKIAVASTEQSSSIGQIDTVIMQLEGNTQKNATQVEDAASSASLLQEQAAKLIDIVRQFQVAEQETHSKKGVDAYPSAGVVLNSSSRKATNPTKKRDTNPVMTSTNTPKSSSTGADSASKKSPSMEPSVLDDEDAWKEF